MEITEIRVKLVGTGSEKLKAFCSVTLDNEFVVRDLKIIEGNGGLFVAMPSRKLADHCGRCRAKNHLRSNYCNDCGARLRPDRAPTDDRGRARLHADIAHPINQKCRDSVQHRIVEEYRKECDRARQVGYVPKTFDDLDYDYDVDADYVHEAENRRAEKPAVAGGHGHVHAPAREAAQVRHHQPEAAMQQREPAAPREPAGGSDPRAPSEPGGGREQGHAG